MRRRTLFLIATLGIFLSSPTVLLAHGGHEHASSLPVNVKWGLEGVRELMNLHPLFTHFPIALLLSSFGFYLLGLLFKKEHLLKTGQWTLYFGTLGAGAAVWTGLQAAGTIPHDETTHATMMAHQYLGITVLVLSVLLSLWLLVSKSSLPKAKPAFMGVLFLITVILLQQVDFGGRLVFFHGVGMGRKSFVFKDRKLSPAIGMDEAMQEVHAENEGSVTGSAEEVAHSHQGHN